MPEREYKLTSTRGVVNFLPGPLIFRMRNGHLWIGTTPQRGTTPGICHLSKRQTEKLIEWLAEGGDGSEER